MMSGRLIPLLIGAATLLTWLFFALDVDAPPRVIVAIPFLLVGPGLALVMLLPIAQPLTATVLAMATSLALEAVVVTALLEIGLWTPGRALTIVGGVTLAAVALRLMGARFGPDAAAGATIGSDRIEGNPGGDS